MFDDANKIIQEFSHLRGLNLLQVCTDGSEDVLNDTVITQPAIFTTSVAVLAALRETSEVFRSLVPKFFMGHSSGEITALVASEALDFETGLRIVCARGLFMKEAGEKHPGGMVAVVGLGDEPIAEVCERDTVYQANKNSPVQTVLSGAVENIGKASVSAKEKGAKFVQRLKVSIASHSPLMEDAAVQVGDFLSNISAGVPRAPIITNVDAQIHESGEEVLQLLPQAVRSTVLWSQSVTRASLEAVHLFEIGPNRILAGLAQRITKAMNGYSTDETLRQNAHMLDPLAPLQQKLQYA